PGPAGQAGQPAAPFIHLAALTALLYIVAPRLLIVVASSVRLWLYRRNPALPADFLTYARTLLRETGQVSALRGVVVTYAFTPTSEALAGLQDWLGQALGADVKLNVRHHVAYGDEDALTETLLTQPLSAADCAVLAMNLSGTPEAENHGAVIAALQRVNSQFLLVVDATTYAARVRDDPSLAPRMAEREAAWHAFATQRGQAACVVDLGRMRAGATPDPQLLERARTAFAPTVSS
ncbi:MAG: hypothetical protein ABW321_19910, partial [Polyangiales bacterium]